MATLPSAAFSINGAAVGAKVAVAAGAAVVATIDDISGVSPVTWAVVNVDDTTATTDYAGAIISGSVDQIWSGTALTAGTAAELKCTVNGGINPLTESDDEELMSYSVKFYVETDVGLEVAVAGEVEDENRLGSATHGIIEAYNELMRAGGGGLGDYKASVRVATDAALPAYARVGNVLTAAGVGALANIDGTAMVAAEDVLLKDGAAGADNGIFRIDTVGDGATAWVMTRRVDADVSAEVTAGMLVTVNEGTVNADKLFILDSNDPLVLNTSALSFVEHYGALATVARQGEVNILGADGTVFISDGATAGGVWSTFLPLGAAAAVASAGMIRMPDLASIVGWGTGPADIDMLTKDASDIVRLGGSQVGALPAAAEIDATAWVRTRIAGALRHEITDTIAEWSLATLQFDFATAAPSIIHEIDATNGVASDLLTLKAQIASGTGATSGGPILVSGGDATGADANTGGDADFQAGAGGVHGGSVSGTLALRTVVGADVARVTDDGWYTDVAVHHNRTVVNFGMTPYLVIATDHVLGVTTAGGALQIDLPAAALHADRHLLFKDEGLVAGGANITIDANAGEFIDGVLTAVIAANGGALHLYCDGTGWYIY